MPGIYTKKILILETDESISRPLVAQLALVGYEPRLTSDIALFLSEALRLHPDMVIIDVGMEGLDGFAAIEALKAQGDPAVAQIPVVIGSALGDLVEISRGLRLGIKDYFVKSTFDPAQLVEKIKKHLGDVQPLPISPVSGAELAMTKLLIVEDDKFLRDLPAQKLSKEHSRRGSARRSAGRPP